jgi:hypothetical protein
MGTLTNYRDPDRGFRMWQRSEIVAVGSTGKWVPNPGDLVFDPAQGFWIVDEVDYTTGFSVLSRWQPPKQDDENEELDVLLGTGPGYSSESYRIFLDQSVTPHTFTPDRRLRFYGSMVHSYKVFLGSDISEEFGRVISSFFDPSGNFLGTSVPVETVVVTDPQGLPVVQNTIKAPVAAYTSEKLADGELVTLVAYDSEGGVVSTAQLLVKNSQAIRQADTSRKYVKSISIDSPFVSSADPQTIEFPINVTVESLPMTALVHYSDGSKHRLPIDGGKFSLYGLRNYIATIVGQQFPMVLAYNLAEDEVSYNLTPTANRRLTMDYTAKTTTADGAYEVKLYIYPVWISPTAGYRLEYWLYNLDRQAFYNVTPYIEMGVNSNPFNPTQYGVTQTLTVALDLNRVDGRFAPYRHVQTFQIALMTRGDDARPSWIIYFRPDQVEGYGRGPFADLEYVNTNYWRLRIGNEFPSKELWLQKLYERIEPLVNEEVEAYAPTPTHFRVVFMHNTYEYTVDQWNDELIVNNDLKHGELVYIQWISRNYDTDLQLGISALPVVIRDSGV